MLRLTIFSFVIVLYLNLTFAYGDPGSGLKIHIDEIKNHPGEIGVAVYNQQTGFPLHLEYAYEVQWFALEPGQEAADVLFDSLPSGEYAVSVVHDENGNRMVDRNPQALPKEGVGFSNDQKVTFRAPYFHESQFAYSQDQGKEMSCKLDYEAGQKKGSYFEPAGKENDEGLSIRVEGIRNNKGEIGVAVYNNKIGYPIHFEHVFDGQWIALKPQQDTIEVAFKSLPAGEYAISVFHDENGNRRLERNFMGFPQEGVGFSNDQKVVLSAPSFEKSKFTLSQEENKKNTIKLDYRDQKEEEDFKEGDLKEAQPPAAKPGVSGGETSKGLTVKIAGIQNREGELGVALFNNKDSYLLNLPNAYELKWVALKPDESSLEIIFDSIPSGEYAVAVFHDENSNKRVDQNQQGFPREGVGFSNNKKIVLHAPSFEQCEVTLLAGENKTINIQLDYKEKKLR